MALILSALVPLGYVSASATNDFGAGWQVMPNAGSSGALLDAVSCMPQADCVAVGQLLRNTFIEQSDAAGWSGEKSPDPAVSPGINTLAGVSCWSASQCMAVGSFTRTSTCTFSPGSTCRFRGAIRALVESSNNKRWSATEPASLAADDLFSGVSCSGSRTCMAVGHSSGPAPESRTLVESWNGSKWSVMTNASVPGVLYGISCATSQACAAVGSNEGRPLIESWDGKRWAVAPTGATPTTPDAYELDAVSCVSGPYCTAVGYTDGSGPDRPVIVHQAGASWTLVSSPNMATGVLQGITCSGLAACTAVGSTGFDNSQALIERFVGGRWVMVAGAPATGAELSGVSCSGVPQMCTAVGSYTVRGATRPLVEKNT